MLSPILSLPGSAWEWGVQGSALPVWVAMEWEAMMGMEIETQLRSNVMAYLLASEKKTVWVKDLEVVGRLALPHESDIGAANRLHELLESLVAEGVLKPIAKAARDKVTGRPVRVVLCRTKGEETRERQRAEFKLLRETTVWVPLMVPLSTTLTQKQMEKAIPINRWLKMRSGSEPIIPHRERALEIFGDEKALDGVNRTPLFGGGISLVDLSCFHCPEPLPYEAYSKECVETKDKPLLVVENANTYWSCCTANKKVGRFAAVVYGKGNMICSLEAACDALPAMERELQASRVLYFGDLDPEGLNIAQRLNERREKAGLSVVEPELCLYAALIQRDLLTPCNAGQWKHDDPAFATTWLGEDLAAAYLAKAPQERWPQEGLGALEIEAALRACTL